MKVVVVVISTECFSTSRQQRLVGEKLLKKKVLRLPRRDATGCRLRPTLKNITNTRSAGSAVPAHETQPTGVRPALIGQNTAELLSHWTEHRRTLLSLDRTSELASLVGGRTPHLLGGGFFSPPPHLLSNLIALIMTICNMF